MRIFRGDAPILDFRLRVCANRARPRVQSQRMKKRNRMTARKSTSRKMLVGFVVLGGSKLPDETFSTDLGQSFNAREEALERVVIPILSNSPKLSIALIMIVKSVDLFRMATYWLEHSDTPTPDSSHNLH